MLLFPKNTKFKKNHSRKKTITPLNYPSMPTTGDFCIYCAESGHITSRQLESVRTLLRRKLKKQARIWRRIFPNTPITKKPNETRMGKGKGNVKYWAYVARPGQVLFEVKGCTSAVAKQAIGIAKKKFSIKTYYHNKYNRWVL